MCLCIRLEINTTYSLLDIEANVKMLTYRWTSSIHYPVYYELWQKDYHNDPYYIELTAKPIFSPG